MSEQPVKCARWWMRRRWYPRTFAEYMATPEKIRQRDAMLAMCDASTPEEFWQAESAARAAQ